MAQVVGPSDPWLSTPTCQSNLGHDTHNTPMHVCDAVCSYFVLLDLFLVSLCFQSEFACFSSALMVSVLILVLVIIIIWMVNASGQI